MRLTIVLGLASATLLAAACGGDDDGGDGDGTQVDAAPGGNPGFPMPTAVTKANVKMNGVWTEAGDADWSCLGTPSTDAPSTQAITLSGKIEDFQTSAADRGAYSINLAQLPSGTTRYGFKFEGAGYVKTYLLNQYIDPTNATAMRDMAAVSESTATALPAFIGVSRDTTKGVLAGAMRDCQNREVSNAVATVSSVAGEASHLTGAKTFYFSAGSSSLPVRHNVSPTMNKDGLFVVLDLPPQTEPAFIQIWGFRNQAELTAGTLTLLSELAAPVEANAVITASVEVKRQ